VNMNAWNIELVRHDQRPYKIAAGMYAAASG
jgi:hypothetical protein